GGDQGLVLLAARGGQDDDLGVAALGQHLGQLLDVVLGVLQRGEVGVVILLDGDQQRVALARRLRRQGQRRHGQEGEQHTDEGGRHGGLLTSLTGGKTGV